MSSHNGSEFGPGAEQTVVQPRAGFVEPLSQVAARFGYMLELLVDVLFGLKFILQNIGTTTIVAIHPDAGKIAARHLDASCLELVAKWAADHNVAGSNLYFHLNEPRPGQAKKASRSEITALRGIFADIDAKGGRTHEQVISTIKRLPPPSIIIASGGGYQPIWLLKEPLSPSQESIARLEALGRRIGNLTGGDAVQNVDRILRVPFTVNYPNATKRADGRVECFSGLLSPRDAAMTTYSQEILEEIVSSCEAAFAQVADNVVQLPNRRGNQHNDVSELAKNPRPDFYDSIAQMPDFNMAAQAGLEDRAWFDHLSPADMNAFLRESSKYPEMIALADAPRAVWLRLLWSLADAEGRGATEAKEIAREWSSTSKRFKEEEFERDWRSFR